MAEKKDTTPKGVSAAETDNGEPATQPEHYTDDTNPKRQTIRESIVGNRRAQLEEELNAGGASLKDEPESPEKQPDEQPKEPDPDEGKAAAEPGDKEKDAKPAPEPTVTVTMADGSVVEVPAKNIRTKVKVSGEEREIGGDQLVPGYQIASEGQRRIREGNERIAAAERREREAEERAAQAAKEPSPDKTPAKKPAAKTPAEDEADESEVRSLALQAAKALQFGDEDEAAEAVLKVINARRGEGSAATSQQPFDPNVVAQVVRSEFAARDYQNNIAKFAAEYPDIVGDADYRDAAIRRVHEIRTQDLTELGHDVSKLTLEQRTQLYGFEQSRGNARSNFELFRSAGDQVREKFGLEAPGAKGSQPSNPMTEKQERKRGAGTPPKRATAFDRKEPEPPKKSPSQTVMEMRKARQQPVAGA